MIFFIAFSSVYIIFLLWVRWQWRKIPCVTNSQNSGDTFSVIVPARNESKNILHLLQGLERQTYPADLFEVLVVNDQSEDDTAEIVDAFINQTSINCRLINVPAEHVGGKKNAITRAVAESKNQFIITTDADCAVQEGWIESFAGSYHNSEAQMISGPVLMNGSNLFTRLQALEFSSLIGIGASTLHSGNPTMCNGANLSYKRSVFEEVHGYEGNEGIPSGDDEFLLQKVYKAYPNGVHFLKNTSAIVSTAAKPSLIELINQRVRWSSKWKFHKSWFIKLMAIMIFLNYVSLIVGATEALGEGLLMYWVGVMLLRWGAHLYYSSAVSQFFKIKGVVGLSLLLEIIYPFFVIFLGIASIFGKYSWKGRYYS